MQKNKLGAAARIIVASALKLTGAGVSPALAQGTAVPPSPISMETTTNSPEHRYHPALFATQPLLVKPQ